MVQVLASVLVEVAQRQGHRIDDDVCPNVGGHVDESSIPLVFEHGIGPAFVVDDKHVLAAIFVVIPPCALETETHVDVDARCLGHVGEREVAVVPQEDVSQPLLGEVGELDVTADVKVQVAVAVHISEGRSAGVGVLLR